MLRNKIIIAVFAAGSLSACTEDVRFSGATTVASKQSDVTAANTAIATCDPSVVTMDDVVRSVVAAGPGYAALSDSQVRELAICGIIVGLHADNQSLKMMIAEGAPQYVIDNHKGNIAKREEDLQKLLTDDAFASAYIKDIRERSLARTNLRPPPPTR